MKKKVYDTEELLFYESRDFIKAYEAPAILGIDPTLSNKKLQEIKKGEVENIEELRPHTESEKKEIPLLRELFQLDFPDLVVEHEANNLFTNNSAPFACSILDGWIHDENNRFGTWTCKIIEYKGPANWALWGTYIPEHYYVQVLHDMIVTNADFAVFEVRIKFIEKGELGVTTKHYFFEKNMLAKHMEFLEIEERKFYESLRYMK